MAGVVQDSDVQRDWLNHGMDCEGYHVISVLDSNDELDGTMCELVISSGKQSVKLVWYDDIYADGIATLDTLIHHCARIRQYMVRHSPPATSEVTGIDESTEKLREFVETIPDWSAA